jgi:hypothetical protein
MTRKLANPRTLMRSRAVVIVAAAALAAMSLGAGSSFAIGAEPQNGFKTAQGSMLLPGSDAPADMEIKPIITVGDMVGSYRFEAIPDGISAIPSTRNAASVFVNHETSTVPFAYVGTGPTAANSQNDFDNAQVSKLEIRRGGGVLSGSYAVPSSANYQRFCSNFLATGDNGFSRPMLFTNEEAVDWVNRAGTAWPATEGDDAARQIGAVVAYDVNASTYRTIWGMGRLNHENNVAVPGYGKPVLLSGDDPFVSSPAQSQVYAYIANNADAVWNDTGDLWAFVSDDPTINDYYDFGIGSTASVSGHFLHVPKEIATGRNADGTDMTSADVPASLGGPYPTPPADGTWARGAGLTSGPGIDGPQWVLEHWGDINNVFQFTRIEDIAFDKRPGQANVVYMADSGRGATSAGGNAFTSSNGRVWRLVLDPSDPTVVQSLSILIEGDDNPVKTLREIHQPDNLETTPNGLYVQEDTGTSQQFDAAQQISDADRATTARIWQYKFDGATLGVVAKIDQSADEGSTDVDLSTTPGRWGEWETSGLLDVSAIFGPGKFLVNVQAHTLWVEKADGPDLVAPAGPDWTFKREGGQLLLLTIPGG